MHNTRCFTLFSVLFFCLLLPFTGQSSSTDPVYHRDFWYPTYHITRLDYCLIDGKTCGMPVASRYCHLMGFHRSDYIIIDHNIGLTHYLATNAGCKGWRCDGFKLIRCVNKIIHKPPAPYYYRAHRFAAPRYKEYRVDWCLTKGKKCGKPAALSFCRRLGYMKTTEYKMEQEVSATKTVGSQELCFGPECRGFSEITCYR